MRETPVREAVGSAVGTRTVRVFLVDDHEVVRCGVADMLAHAGEIEVVGEAATAAQAIARIRAVRPDVVVIDVRLPDGDGPSVCRELRATLAPPPAFLFFTSYADHAPLFAAVDAGAAGFLLKEVSRLALTMNLMLDRLQDGSDRQRAFVADASHELQSPLTAMRTQLEVGLADGAHDWPGTARLLLCDTDEMERLVRDLLFLARTHDGSPAHRADLLDLDRPLGKTVELVAERKGTDPTDVMVVVLDRPRHEEGIAEIVEAGGDAQRALVGGVGDRAVRRHGKHPVARSEDGRGWSRR